MASVCAAPTSILCHAAGRMGCGLDSVCQSWLPAAIVKLTSRSWSTERLGLKSAEVSIALRNGQLHIVLSVCLDACASCVLASAL